MVTGICYSYIPFSCLIHKIIAAIHIRARIDIQLFWNPTDHTTAQLPTKTPLPSLHLADLSPASQRAAGRPSFFP